MIAASGMFFDSLMPPETCLSPLIEADFWNDMRWLNVPTERQTLFVKPRRPRGGLLGGSPDAVPKMSKLQALAAARKKKAQEEKLNATSDRVDQPMADLTISQNVGKEEPSVTPNADGSSTAERSRVYLVRKRKNSSQHRKSSLPEEPAESSSIPQTEVNIQPPVIEQARPSAFASTMFGNNDSFSGRHLPGAFFILPFQTNSSLPSTDAFAGPSPDDTVLTAQSKGSMQSTKPNNKSY